MSDELYRANAHFEDEHYALALPLYQSVLRVDQKQQNIQTIVPLLSQIAACYAKLGDSENAARYFKLAAASADPAWKIAALISASQQLRRIARYSEAESELRGTLLIIDDASAKGLIDSEECIRFRVTVNCTLGAILRTVERSSEAQPLFELALSLLGSSGKASSQEAAEPLSALAGIYVSQGLLAKALETARRAQAVASPDDWDVLGQLGAIKSRMGQFDEAVAYFKRACDVAISAYGSENHAIVAMILTKVAANLKGVFNFAESLDHYVRAQLILEGLCEQESMLYADVLSGIASLYYNTGVKHQQALKYAHRAVAVFRKLLPPDHPQIWDTLKLIALIETVLGNSEAAAATFAAVAVLQRRSQNQCAAAGCPCKLKADGTPLDQCGGCKRCYYCSKVCQLADWKAGHKAECKMLRDDGK